MITKVKAKGQKSIIPKFTVTTTAVPQIIGGFDCVISCITGNLWFDTLNTATSLTGFKLAAGDSICINVENTVSFISDVTGADVQILILTE